MIMTYFQKRKNSGWIDIKTDLKHLSEATVEHLWEKLDQLFQRCRIIEEELTERCPAVQLWVKAGLLQRTVGNIFL